MAYRDVYRGQVQLLIKLLPIVAQEEVGRGAGVRHVGPDTGLRAAARVGHFAAVRPSDQDGSR